MGISEAALEAVATFVIKVATPFFVIGAVLGVLAGWLIWG
jgi:hypothetical protein